MGLDYSFDVLGGLVSNGVRSGNLGLIDHVTGPLDVSGPAVYSGALTDIDGAASAWVCFQYGGVFSWYAQVDNVAVRGSDCSAAVADTDGDGVLDNEDNCITFANPGQEDTNGDGYGNACDADITQSCNVSFGDLSAFKAAFPPNPPSPDADFNGNGLVDFGDLARLKETFFTGVKPGPGPSAAGPNCVGGVASP